MPTVTAVGVVTKTIWLAGPPTVTIAPEMSFCAAMKPARLEGAVIVPIQMRAESPALEETKYRIAVLMPTWPRESLMTWVEKPTSTPPTERRPEAPTVETTST